ncbi:FHA domain-containing protein [Ruegeria sp. SCPT10]|uniref:FHA domain-containing protein n=1 Tax=Ruegeria sp. SCP10 TaxID=3141377 RepID=UPI00333C6C4C
MSPNHSVGAVGVADIAPNVGAEPFQRMTETPMEELVSAPVSRPVSANPRGTRTRLIGFDTSEGITKDLFSPDNAPEPEQTLPVGWLVIVSGPGRGYAFTLRSGLSRIGRNPDQTICLDFGDMAVSRDNHAAIAYDPEENGYFLGHGGKTNIVRLQGKPIISTEKLNDGDRISIGETTMVFKALCDKTFNWIVGDDDEDMVDFL